jgi:hypothetical protein
MKKFTHKISGYILSTQKLHHRFRKLDHPVHLFAEDMIIKYKRLRDIEKNDEYSGRDHNWDDLIIEQKFNKDQINFVSETIACIGEKVKLPVDNLQKAINWLIF